MKKHGASTHCQTARLLLISVGFLLFVGCAGRTPEVVLPVGVAPLAKNEGFLIVQIDTDQPIERAVASGVELSGALPIGTHIWIVRMPAGRYEWDLIFLPASAGLKGKLVLDSYKTLRHHEEWLWKDEFRFEVEAGVINYPGELILRSEPNARSANFGRVIRNRNHSAMAIRELMVSHRDFLAQYPIRHSGPGKDGFLDYYSKQRDRLAEQTHVEVNSEKTGASQ